MIDASIYMYFSPFRIYSLRYATGMLLVLVRDYLWNGPIGLGPTGGLKGLATMERWGYHDFDGRILYNVGILNITVPLDLILFAIISNEIDMVGSKWCRSSFRGEYALTDDELLGRWRVGLENSVRVFGDTFGPQSAEWLSAILDGAIGNWELEIARKYSLLHMYREYEWTPLVCFATVMHLKLGEVLRAIVDLDELRQRVLTLPQERMLFEGLLRGMDEMYGSEDRRMFANIIYESTLLEQDFLSDVVDALKERFDDTTVGPSSSLVDINARLSAIRLDRLGYWAFAEQTERGAALFDGLDHGLTRPFIIEPPEVVIYLNGAEDDDDDDDEDAPVMQNFAIDEEEWEEAVLAVVDWVPEAPWD